MIISTKKITAFIVFLSGLYLAQTYQADAYTLNLNTDTKVELDYQNKGINRGRPSIGSPGIRGDGSSGSSGSNVCNNLGPYCGSEPINPHSRPESTIDKSESRAIDNISDSIRNDSDQYVGEYGVREIETRIGLLKLYFFKRSDGVWFVDFDHRLIEYTEDNGYLFQALTDLDSYLYKLIDSTRDIPILKLGNVYSNKKNRYLYIVR